jgi:hypothetical protein
MRWVAALALSLWGCDDNGPLADPYRCIAAGGEGCFELPTDVIGAATPEGVPTMPVLDCGPYVIEQSAGSLMFSGLTVDLLDMEQALGTVRIEAFADLAFGTKLFDTTSDDVGAWSASASVPSEAFARTTAPGALPLLFLYGRIDINDPVHDMFDFQTATREQVESVVELVGDRFLPGKTQVAVLTEDCVGNRLVNVIANIAPASGRNGTRLFEPGVRVYYGIEGAIPILARRTELSQTSTSGSLALTNVAPGKHYVQLWGFPTAAAIPQGHIGLELLDEKEIQVPDGDNGILMPLHGRL